MELFHEIPEGLAIVRTKGVFKQVKIYRRDRDVYAQHGSGFIRLLQHGGTTAPAVHWLEMAGDGVSQVPGRGPTWSAD